MAKVALIVVCGLPGAGKSTLCERLKATSNCEYVIKHICYDSLMPANLEKNLVETGRWKSFRDNIEHLVSNSLSHICQKTMDQSSKTTDNVEISELIGRYNEMIGSLDGCEAKPVLVLLDDNMYYRSMRYKYYQLARQWQCGFGVVVMDVGLDTAVNRVHSRGDGRVELRILEEMHQKFEKPDAGENAWEKQHMMISDLKSCDSHSIADLLFNFFKAVIENPLSRIPEIDKEQLEESRKQCSKNTLHQVDQILRKLVSLHMMGLIDMSKSEKKREAEKVNGLRQTIIDQIHVGKFHVPECESDASKDADSDFYKFIAMKFHDELYKLY